jgi:hypothetical protein
VVLANCIGNKGALEFARVLKENDYVTFLNLEGEMGSPRGRGQRLEDEEA